MFLYERITQLAININVTDCSVTAILKLITNFGTEALCYYCREQTGSWLRRRRSECHSNQSVVYFQTSVHLPLCRLPAFRVFKRFWG